MAPSHSRQSSWDKGDDGTEEEDIKNGTKVRITALPQLSEQDSDEQDITSANRVHGYSPIDAPGRSRGGLSPAPQISASATSRPTTPSSPLETGLSIFRRLSRLGSNKGIAPSFSRRRPKSSRYATIDEDGDEEFVGVDLSTFDGPGLQMTEISRQPLRLAIPPALQPAPAPGEIPRPAMTTGSDTAGHQVGGGLVVGARLQVDAPQELVQRARSNRLAPSLEPQSAIERAKSIRAYGQREAEQRQAIVEVSEPIDISTWDVEHVRRRESNQSFETMINASQTPGGPAQPSYFFPPDPNLPNWRPFSMRPTYIIMLILISFGIAVFQEWLCRDSMAKAGRGTGILHFKNVSDVTLWNFFLWKYFPTLLFVIYGVLWSIMDYEIKRLEPYYQLSQRDGSTAAESLNLDHLMIWNFLVPFKALHFKQWAVFVSSVGSILATSIAPALQNPSVNFYENSPNAPPDQRYLVNIVPVYSRLLTATMAVTAALGVILFFQLRRKSGLLNDPRGIAGIASMAVKSHILNDFQGLDLATHRQIHKRLRHRRFVLHKSSIWQGEYMKQAEKMPSDNRKVENPHPLMLRMSAGYPFIGALVVCLILIPIVNFTPANYVPINAPWLPILIATIIKMVWTTFESDCRMIEPFYLLSKGDCYPERSLTLDYQGTPYGWFPLKALFNGDWLLSLVGFCSILLDLLTVTVTSFSVNGEGFLKHHGPPGTPQADQGDQTFRSFWGSVIISMVILLVSILSAILVYVRRRHPFLPREPSTIAAVLAFIHASRMLDDFIDTERMTNAQMEEMLKRKGKKYALAWFRGRDGQIHCAIDEEPYKSRYVHGKPYHLAQAPWENNNDFGYV